MVIQEICPTEMLLKLAREYGFMEETFPIPEHMLPHHLFLYPEVEKIANLEDYYPLEVCPRIREALASGESPS